MKTENLSTLKINILSQDQFDREDAAGNISATEIYLTPDEDTYTHGELDAMFAEKAAVNHVHSISNVSGLQANLDSLGDAIDGKVAVTRKINGKVLSADITLSAGDVDAYTKSEIDSYELITVTDIDEICGTTIQVASDSEVTF